MATIHQVTLTPGKDELVSRGIDRQRWYTSKAHQPRLRRLDSWRLDDPDGEVGIETLVYLDEAADEQTTYEVPLTYRGAPLPGGEAALVGELEHPVLGHRWVYDGPHDPVFARQLLALLRGEVQAQHGQLSDTALDEVVGAPHPAWTHHVTVTRSRVLVGEQSNTSLILDTVDDEGVARPVIAKVFRVLAAGDNPDITLQSALAACHCPSVPAAVGHVAGAWARPEGDDQDLGQLAVAQEFLPGSEDAWRVGLRLAAAGTPFADRAAALGAATADVHDTLARALPTVPATPQRRDTVVAEMRRRLDLATSEVPSLGSVVPQVQSLYDTVATLDWPDLQRIHGDYHLGQVLDVPGRGWVLIDFEGEPLRPLAERNRPDLPLRDVAGMLRSLDYAGGSVELGQPGLDARDWVHRAQEAFLDGYASRAAEDPRRHRDLLRALEIDKALYEVVYESRNRPTWLPIPTTAITRLLEGTDA